MTPAARLQAAVEILDEVIVAARDEGPPADAIVQRYFKARRYAGSKDRRAVRELVFRAIRLCGERPASGRAAMLAVAGQDPTLAALFDGSPHGPAPIRDEEAAAPGIVPAWLMAELDTLVGPDELPTLIGRAPIDLRVNVDRTNRKAMLGQFAEGKATPLSPWGIRLPADSQVSGHPAFEQGLVEIQDEGSQLVALACAEHAGDLIIDLCAGAGGKTLALDAAVGGEVDILACDTNRARLDQLGPRAERAGATVATRLLDPGKEAAELHDYAGSADVVLVDAPCSGSGTWRRNPEGRWRLTPARLDRVTALQKQLLDVAVELVKPGGCIVYAVCSLLRREGAGQAEDFLIRHSSWLAQDINPKVGRLSGGGRLLTPAHDATDGFFVARFVRPC